MESYNINRRDRTKIIYQFMDIYKASPPQEQHQLEAFGGTLHNISIHGERPIHEGLNIEHIQFIITLCAKHVKINYLVACILEIIRIFLVYAVREYALLIVPKVYTFLVFLTKYRYTTNYIDIYWSLDLMFVWTALFDIDSHTPARILRDTELIPAFSEILTLPTRKNLVPYRSVHDTNIGSYILVREGLAIIHTSRNHTFCFDYIFPYLKELDVLFVKKLAKHCPFILKANGELLEREQALEIIQTLIRNETYPKSASKRK
jgi:hypothetical protein